MFIINRIPSILLSFVRSKVCPPHEDGLGLNFFARLGTLETPSPSKCGKTMTSWGRVIFPPCLLDARLSLLLVSTRMTARGVFAGTK